MTINKTLFSEKKRDKMKKERKKRRPSRHQLVKYLIKHPSSKEENEGSRQKQKLKLPCFLLGIHWHCLGDGKRDRCQLFIKDIFILVDKESLDFLATKHRAQPERHVSPKVLCWDVLNAEPIRLHPWREKKIVTITTHGQFVIYKLEGN